MTRIDLTGQRFGRLVAIKDAGYDKNRSRVWECICDCGNMVLVRGSSLKSGNTKSCGCFERELARINVREANKWSRNNDLKEHTRLSAIVSNIRSDNTSGVTGVFWKESKKLWIARLYFKGVFVLDSSFIKKEDAIRARHEAEEKYFKPILKKYHRVEIEV
ncbi:alcohol dehydrogenase [Lacticaseibacillus mingshuiensis]|uniref:alcohol dehydrogenase n=1 Tax=Lacticaseibacillus mingshuiensis TaxID=2799574 RepID=UPI00194FB38C|nr:alcohol dehydrogenase [Lacticaseibacillus mingshuiensis]